MAWVSGDVSGVVMSGTVVADTEELPSSTNRTIGFIVNSTSTCNLLLQHRNAANNGTVHQQEISLTANSSSIFVSPNAGIGMETDERLRIVTSSAIGAGSISASIFYG